MKKLIIISSSLILVTGGLEFYSASSYTYNIGITNNVVVTPAAHRYWFKKTRKELLRDDNNNTNFLRKAIDNSLHFITGSTLTHLLPF